MKAKKKGLKKRTGKDAGNANTKKSAKKTPNASKEKTRLDYRDYCKDCKKHYSDRGGKSVVKGRCMMCSFYGMSEEFREFYHNDFNLYKASLERAKHELNTTRGFFFEDADPYQHLDITQTIPKMGLSGPNVRTGKQNTTRRKKTTEDRR